MSFLDLPRFWILDDEHHIVETDMHTWGRWFENISNRLVDYTEITSETHVSTVFLGIDHRYHGDGPPLLFETMIFGRDDEDEGCWRYTSWDDAKTGHEALVKKLRNKCKKVTS